MVMALIQLIGFLVILLEHKGNYGQSLARLKNVTLSSQYASWVGSNAVDGNYNRKCGQMCCAAANIETHEVNPWIQIDLGETNTFTRIVLYGPTDGEFGGQSLNGLTLYLDSELVSSINTAEPIYDFYHFELSRPYSARHIKFVMGGNDTVLVLCEVDIYNDTIISTGRITSSSTTYSDWVSSLAVDGLISTHNPDTCRCCAGTVKQTDPWLIVDLGDKFLVTLIQIHGRTDEEFGGQSYEGLKIQLDGTDLDTVPNGRFINYYQLFSASENIGRYVKFILDGSERLLVICEVVIYGERVISIGKQSSISTIYSDWQASRAVDGDYRTVPSLCNCCTATLYQKDPYLRLNLGNVYRVTRISIYGRTDKLYAGQNFKGMSINSSNSFTREVTAQEPDQWINFYSFQLSTLVLVSEITVILPGDNQQLVVCELIVYGDCSDGYFGGGCLRQCHCEGLPCNTITGVCPSRICKPGYRGTTCSKNCQTSRYGQNCSEPCGHCKSGQTCNHITGHCSECVEEGYYSTDPLCKTVCIDGKYGYNCSSTCGNCRQDKPCNKTTGVCEECADGYKYSDSHCITDSENGTYGRKCSKECGNCTHNEICDKVNGECRYYCQTSWYGQNCSEPCGHCISGQTCSHITGHCSECAEGYYSTDPLCKTVCIDGKYGYNCSSTCGNCRQDKPCNKTTGVCEECADGYKYSDSHCITECENGTFGRNCFNECGNCTHNDICDKVDGHCTYCMNRYNETDMTCTTVCDDGSYGFECNNTCSYHCQNESCHHISGNCNCIQGYGGNNCEDEQQTQTSEDANTATPVIAGVTSLVAIVAVIVVALVIIQRRRSNNQAHNAHTKPESVYANNVMFNETSLIVNNENRPPEDTCTNGKPEAENEYCNVITTSHGILIRQLWDYIATKKQDNNEKFANEFADLSDGLIFPHNDALANRQKNRYREMFPYDHSRVHLKVEANKESEFVNASHIDGYIEERKFIASQGPTKVMVDDFWRMVWQQKTNKIVMLTNLVETGTVKCIQYWPDEGSLTFERINITLIKESIIPDYTVRILEIKQDNEKPRKVVQFHYKAWPDKDVPDSTWSLVQFWRKVFKEKEIESGPVVVHCSAGVGRTGTFIALDNLYHQAISRGSVTPFDVVEMLRQQRVKMVQTCEQYVYLHEAVADALLFGTHHVWQSQFSDYYDFMIKKDKDNGHIRLKVQYQISNNSLEEKRPIDGKDLCAAEMDEYRPKKYNGDKMGNSDITLLPGIGGGNIYLLTRIPNDGTMGECLEIADNHNVKTIITLVEDKQYTKNPWSVSKQVYGDFQLSRDSEKGTVSFVERTFTYTKDLKKAGSSNPQTRSISQFDLALSPNVSQESHGAESVIRLLNSVCIKHPHMSSNERIMIQSSDITNKGSVICAILNEKMRMSTEGGHINILESVISLRRRDRSCISTYEQYRYIHDVILQIVENEEKHVVELSDDDCNIYQNM